MSADFEAFFHDPEGRFRCRRPPLVPGLPPTEARAVVAVPFFGARVWVEVALPERRDGQNGRGHRWTDGEGSYFRSVSDFLSCFDVGGGPLRCEQVRILKMHHPNENERG